MQAGFAFSRFVDRLASLADLSPGDLELIAHMPSSICHLGPQHTILRKTDQPKHCCLLLQGYLCWEDAESHQGQITSIHVPGDVPDLHTLHDPQIDGNLATLGPAVVAFVPQRFFRDICLASPGISRALLLMLLADHAMSRNWAVNLGSRDALARVAHLLCEITARLQNVGLARDFQIPSPFTQSDLAAACSISPVHANRTIMELRRANLLQWQAKTIRITDWPRLVRVAGFNPSYLRLRARRDHPSQMPAMSPPGEAEATPA